jgi:nitrogen fixation-related uncharacterized protein
MTDLMTLIVFGYMAFAVMVGALVWAIVDSFLSRR